MNSGPYFWKQGSQIGRTRTAMNIYSDESTEGAPISCMSSYNQWQDVDYVSDRQILPFLVRLLYFIEIFFGIMLRCSY